MRAVLSWGAFCLLLIGVVGVGRTAERPGPSRDPTKEEAYAAPLENVDPALATLFHQGTAAMDAGRATEARADYEKILVRAGDHAPTLRRLSYIVAAAGEFDKAVELARRAQAAEPGKDNDAALARALIADPSAGPDALREAGEVADRLLADRGDQLEEMDAATAAMVAGRRKDLAQLGLAVAALDRLAPNGVAANYMGAIAAAARDDLATAERRIARAEAAGLPASEAARFRADSGIDRRRHLIRAGQIAGGLLALWALGLLAIFVGGKLLSAATLRAVERHAPEPGDGLVSATRKLRRIYAFAIGLAGVYYYISIPIVIFVVLALMGLVLYGILQAGYVPIKAVVIILVAGGFTVWGLARSLFARRGKDQDPGQRLPETAAPALWTALREIAAAVGTRPVDEVFITPGTEIAVTERGSMAERLRDRGNRQLILGVAVLEGLTDLQLRAVLAHEYGHFSNRDTAGGNVAAQVRVSLMAAVIRIARSGGGGLFNPGWQFLRLFFALFQRVTLGASRLQEVLADRFAAVGYGGAVFAEGLRHVVRRNIQFSAEANVVIRRSQEKSLAIANLYAPVEEGSVDRNGIEKAIEKAMTDPGTPYDSHPPIERRVAWVAHFEPPAGLPAAAPAWSLFPDRAQLEAAMTGVVNLRLGHDGPPSPASFLTLGAPKK
jgi:Zn-dependent protease with chaperone function